MIGIFRVDQSENKLVSLSYAFTELRLSLLNSTLNLARSCLTYGKLQICDPRKI